MPATHSGQWSNSKKASNEEESFKATKKGSAINDLIENLV